MNAKPFSMLLLWTLAILLPGGLPLLALYYSARAARDRQLLTPARTSVVPTPAIQG